MDRCVVCGRKLKTGRKYCYLHKGYIRQNQVNIKRKSDGFEDLFIWFVGAIIAIIALYIAYILLTFLVASFVLPIVCGTILFFKIKKIKKSGMGSLTKKEMILISVSVALFSYSIYWWMYFWITGKTFV